MEKDLDSGRLFFDPSANRASMLFLGNNNNVIFPAGQRAMMSMEENVTKKRPFFTSPDELFYDEEYYYDEQLPEKKRRLTPDQVVSLEKSFEVENKLEPERKSELAKKLGLQPRQVAVWFQNRRARSKTKQLERDYDVLKASYDSLLSNYDSILKENALLKTQVHSLSEKLETKEVQVNNMVGPKSDPVQALQLDDGPNIVAQEKLNKVEDRQSSGSGGSSSAVENEENFPMVMDSTCDSYLGCHPTSPYMVAAVAGHSEEDDISNDGRICFSNYFAVDHHDVHHLQEEEVGHELGWWVWS